MAAKVNTKFVIGLIVALIVLAGGVGAAAFLVLFKSAADHAKAGEVALAAGDVEAAESAFSKAVAKDMTNVEYLRRWTSTLQKIVPETEAKFDELYQRRYLPGVKRIADQLKTDVDAHRDYLDLLYDDMVSSSFSRDFCEYLIDQTNSALQNFAAPGTGDSEDYGPGNVLRRYRGIAATRMIVAGTTVSEELEARVLPDLEAALKADPKDADSALAIEAYYNAKANTARRTGGEWTTFLEKGRQAVRDFIQANPDNPRALLSRTSWVGDDATIAASTAATQEERQKIVDDLRVKAPKELDAVEAAFLKADLKTMHNEPLFQLYALERQFDETGKYTRSEKVLTAALAQQPTSAPIISLLADVQGSRREYDAAIATLQKVIDLQPLPVSLTGRRLNTQKNNAAFGQALLALSRLEAETDATKRNAALEQVRTYRERLSKREPDTSPRMKLVDGRIRMAENNWPEAKRLLEAFLTESGSADISALMGAATASLQLNQPGPAREHLTRVVQIQPSNIAAQLRLAELEAQLNEIDAAITRLENTKRLVNDPAPIQARIDDFRIRKGEIPADASPLTRSLAQAMLLQREGKTAEAEKILTDAMVSTKGEKAVALALAELRFSTGNRDGAVAAIDEGLKVNPQDINLQQARQIASMPDMRQARDEFIKLSSLTPLQKLVARHQLAREYEDVAGADALVDEALKLDPGSPDVLEMVFSRAYMKKDLAGARAAAEKASAVNADLVGGATYGARIAIMEDKPAEAITILSQAAQRVNFTPEAYRLLGAVQLNQGRVTEAAASFRAALALRPNDVSTMLSLAGALIRAQQPAEALAELRKGRIFAEGNPQFRDVWLSLEAASGDPEVALVQRQRDLAGNPKDRDLRGQVATLCVKTRRFDQARKLIDELRAEQDGLDAASLDASWHAEQGNLEAGEKVLRDFITKLPPDKRTVDPYLVLFQFLSERRLLERAIAVLEEARSLQDPKTMLVDRTMGNALMQAGLHARAAESFRRVVDANADEPSAIFQMRLAECLINQGKAAEAEQELVKIEAKLAAAGSKQDILVALLRAETIRAQGKNAEAVAALNKVVLDFPNEPAAYFKRAQVLLFTPGGQADAMADLEKTLEIDPGFWQALSLRATLARNNKEADKFLADAKESLRLNPLQDGLVGSVMGELMTVGKFDEAFGLADDLQKRRATDVALAMFLADEFRGKGRPEVARDFYERALNINSDTRVALALFSLLMDKNSPRPADAEKLLTRLGAQRIAAEPGLLLARARLANQRNLAVEAKRDMLAAFRLMPKDNPLQHLGWYRECMEILGPAGMKQLIELCRAENVKPYWVDYYQIYSQLNDPATEEAGLKNLDAFRQTVTEPSMKSFANEDLSQRLYLKGRYDEAIVMMRESLAGQPDNPGLLNNLAFALAKHGGKPDEALPLAKKAAELAPGIADVADTLGFVSMLSGDFTQAEQNFVRADRLATSPGTRATVSLHLAELRMRQAEKDPARKAELVEAARGFVSQSEQVVSQEGSQVTDEVKAEVAAMKERLDKM